MMKPHSTTRRSAPGLDPNEKKKLWIMGVLFVLVLAGFLGSRIFSAVSTEEGAEGKDLAPGMDIDIAPQVNESGDPIFKLKKLSPSEKRALVEDDLRGVLAGFLAVGKLNENEESDDPEVLEKLLNEGIWNAKVTQISPLFYRRLDEDAAQYKPDPLRGKLTSAFGKLVSVSEPHPFPGRVKGVEALYRAVFLTEDGRYYRILKATPIAKKVGEWIQVYGIFWRLSPYEAEGKKHTAFNLYLTKPVKPAYPPIAVTAIDKDWAKDVREGEFSQAHGIQERAFWLIMNYVRGLGIDGYRKKRDAGEITVKPFGTEGKDILKSVKGNRFEFVSVEGKIVGPVLEFLENDNPGKIERMDGAVLMQPRFMVRLASPRPWHRWDFRMSQEYVRVEGIFYKAWQYVPRGGADARVIPLLIVTDIVPTDNAAERFGSLLQWIFGGLALVVVGAFFVLAFKDRKQMKEFRRGYRARRQKRDTQETGSDATDDGAS